MKSLYQFIVKPKKERYDNIRKVDNNELIINTNIEDHRFVSKAGFHQRKGNRHKCKSDDAINESCQCTLPKTNVLKIIT